MSAKRVRNFWLEDEQRYISLPADDPEARLYRKIGDIERLLKKTTSAVRNKNHRESENLIRAARLRLELLFKLLLDLERNSK